MKSVQVLKYGRITKRTLVKYPSNIISVDVWHLGHGGNFHFHSHIKVNGSKTLGFIDTYSLGSLQRELKDVKTLLELDVSQFTLKGSTLPRNFLQTDILKGKKKNEL